MIALSCRSILMGKHSNLGPIDPQVAGVPAHGIIDEFWQAKREGAGQRWGESAREGLRATIPLPAVECGPDLLLADLGGDGLADLVSFSTSSGVKPLGTFEVRLSGAVPRPGAPPRSMTGLGWSRVQGDGEIDLVLASANARAPCRARSWWVKAACWHEERRPGAFRELALRPSWRRSP